MPSQIDPLPSSDNVALDVCGAVPAGLSGRLLGIGGDGVAHAVELRADRTVWFRSRRLLTASPVANVVVFGGAVLAFGDDSPAYEVSADLEVVPVDLAGHGRTLAAYPRVDPITGELHLIATDPEGTQTHVVVSAGALTRRSRPVLDAPARIRDLAVTRDHVVFVADGFLGMARRDGEPRATWITTGPAVHTGHAHKSDFVFVSDTARPGDLHGGWLVGFVHDASSATTELRVIDANRTEAPAVATVRLPRPIPRRLRCTWIPATTQQ